MSREAMQIALYTLNTSKRSHYYCEDRFYSCPKHEEGCANDLDGDECNCSADFVNETIERAIEALRAALAQPEKIECSRSHPHENMGSHCQLRTEIARLTNENARLKAQPEPEPIAYLYEFWADPGYKHFGFEEQRFADNTPLYTTPPPREFIELTNVEAYTLIEECTDPWELISFTQEKLKEKNT